jgi:hypothetical protein
VLTLSCSHSQSRVLLCRAWLVHLLLTAGATVSLAHHLERSDCTSAVLRSHCRSAAAAAPTLKGGFQMHAPALPEPCKLKRNWRCQHCSQCVFRPAQTQEVCLG